MTLTDSTTLTIYLDDVVCGYGNATTFTITNTLTLSRPSNNYIDDIGNKVYGTTSIIGNIFSNFINDIGNIIINKNSNDSIISGGILKIYNVIHLRIVGRE